MGSGSSQISTKALKAFECPVCLEEYRDPRILPDCGHTICATCLWHLERDLCPKCKTPFTKPRESFFRNYQLLETIHAYHEAESCARLPELQQKASAVLQSLSVNRTEVRAEAKSLRQRLNEAVERQIQFIQGREAAAMQLILKAERMHLYDIQVKKKAVTDTLDQCKGGADTSSKHIENLDNAIQTASLLQSPPVLGSIKSSCVNNNMQLFTPSRDIEEVVGLEEEDLYADQPSSSSPLNPSTGKSVIKIASTSNNMMGRQETTSSSSSSSGEAVSNITSTLDNMKGNLQNASIQVIGCMVLADLIMNEANQVSFTTAGGIATVLEAMKLHASASGVQEQGCAVFCNITYNSASNRVFLAASGGIIVIIRAMRRHASVLGVQEQGCQALFFVAWSNDANRALIAAAGGIEAILDAMRWHASAAVLQELGCRSLCTVAWNNNGNRASIAAAGGITVTVDAMKQHASVPGVQEQGCGLLTSIASNNQWDGPGIKLIIAAGGIEATVSAMRRHAAVLSIQEQGCAVLLNIIKNSDANRAVVAAKGGISAISDAISLHASGLSSSVLSAGSRGYMLV